MANEITVSTDKVGFHNLELDSALDNANKWASSLILGSDFPRQTQNTPGTNPGIVKNTSRKFMAQENRPMKPTQIPHSLIYPCAGQAHCMLADSLS